MAEAGFQIFLSRSLRILESEANLAYGAVAHRLSGRRVGIAVDGERLSVSSTNAQLLVERSLAPVVAEARASRYVLKRLLVGERELIDAVCADEVSLQGELEDLIAFYEALLLYFLGAVRCPSFPEVLREFLAGVEHAAPGGAQTGSPTRVGSLRRTAS